MPEPIAKELIYREYQPLIPSPPTTQDQMYSQACSADGLTVSSWRNTWLENYRSAKAKFGKLGDHSYGKLHGTNARKPAAVMGSGPSVMSAVETLRDKDMLSISCLHNFAAFEDVGWHPTYYLTLDAGAVVIDDMCEAGSKDREHYFNATEAQKLIACSFTDPRLLDLWKGEVYFYNCLIPDQSIRDELDKIERFSHFISSGGNALGAAMYTAKAVMGSNPIMYVGADFCFSYDHKFHPWGSKYDSLGNAVRCTDVFGLPRHTWQSYYNFKVWFDYIAWKVPGIWYNCSEGILGAYRDGNIALFKYDSLENALVQYNINDKVFLDKMNKQGERIERVEVELKTMFSDPTFPENIVLF